MDRFFGMAVFFELRFATEETFDNFGEEIFTAGSDWFFRGRPTLPTGLSFGFDGTNVGTGEVVLLLLTGCFG